MEISWAEHMSVGNETIDSDHKNLIVVVNRVQRAIATGDRAALSKSFELLETYMIVHFKNEERIAEAVNFPFDHIKMEHLKLVNEMNNMKNILESISGKWPDHMAKTYSHYLSDWMTDHVMKDDMKLKQVLQTYPYDFKPD